MDHQRSSHVWRILLAISQVAAAVQIEFKKVESAPMARFHSIGQVFPDALYGHIIITFDVAVLYCTKRTNKGSPRGDIIQAGESDAEA
jgi:hypothetical protein